jgi:glycosyltransferase involved in cell wall biosynthesis
MISACVCTHNPRRDVLERCLAALKAQRIPQGGLELVIIDNRSCEALVPEALRLSIFPYPARLVREEHLGLSMARSRALREATGEVIIFVDDDNFLDPDYACAAAQIFRDLPRAGVVGGACRPELETTPPPWFDQAAGHLAITDHGNNRICLTLADEDPPAGAGLALRREAFESALNVPLLLKDRRGPQLSSGGDTELCVRIRMLGWECWYEPAMRLRHFIPETRLNPEHLTRLNEGFGHASCFIELYSDFRPSWRPLWRLRRWRYHHRLALADEAKARRTPDESDALRLRLHAAFHRGKARGLRELIMARGVDAQIEPFLRAKKGRNTRRDPGHAMDAGTPATSHERRRNAEGGTNPHPRPLPSEPGEGLLRVMDSMRGSPTVETAHEPANSASPSVSVVIPTFNRARFIPEAIRSAQTRLVREIIVIDDGSTDDTLNVLQSLNDPQLRWFFQSNRGPAAARNRGLREARGEWIAFLDSDDAFAERGIEALFAAALRAPGSVPTGRASLHVFDLDKPAYSELAMTRRSGWIAREFCRVPVATIFASLFPRHALLEVGGFSEDPAVHLAEDFDLGLRMVLRHPFVFVDQPCYKIRMHRENRHAPVRPAVATAMAHAVRWRLRGRFRYMPLRRRFLSTLECIIAMECADAGDLRAARRHYALSLRTWPLKWRPLKEWLRLSRISGLPPSASG